jgi:hypothetical protein
MLPIGNCFIVSPAAPGRFCTLSPERGRGRVRGISISLACNERSRSSIQVFKTSEIAEREYDTFAGLGVLSYE